MNKTKYLALAFAALTLGACTSDDVVSTGGGKDDGNATGYLSFAINLPSMSGNTRAGWGDTGVFDDGEERNNHSDIYTCIKLDGNAFRRKCNKSLGSSYIRIPVDRSCKRASCAQPVKQISHCYRR